MSSFMCLFFLHPPWALRSAVPSVRSIFSLPSLPIRMYHPSPRALWPSPTYQDPPAFPLAGESRPLLGRRARRVTSSQMRSGWGLSACNRTCLDSQEPPAERTVSFYRRSLTYKEKSFFPNTRVGQMFCLAVAAVICRLLSCVDSKQRT